MRGAQLDYVFCSGPIGLGSDGLNRLTSEGLGLQGRVGPCPRPNREAEVCRRHLCTGGAPALSGTARHVFAIG